MSVARTARRRRLQAKKHFRHMAPLRRPKYCIVPPAKAARRLRIMLEKQKRMQNSKNVGKTS